MNEAHQIRSAMGYRGREGLVLSPRYFFAAGPGNVIQAHKNWRDGIDDPGQMSITFSSEFAEFCRDNNASAYIVASAAPADTYQDGETTIEHRPKTAARGLKFHLNELLYGLNLVRTAVIFKADYAFLQTGSTHYFVMSFFRLFGIKVIPILHNTLWPSGHPPTSPVSRIILFLDSLFFRWVASGALCVSPECARQIDRIVSGRHGPLEIFLPQFNPELFRPAAPPPPGSPFRLLFAGRILADKGAFDLLEIMKIVETKNSGSVTLDICGDGPHLSELRTKCTQMSLDNIITIHGFTLPAVLRQLMTACHASIVPTRSGFAEGMAMTAIEPVLLGRPVITSPVVPALEVLRSACVEAKTDDVESYADAIINLAADRSKYDELICACGPLQEQFFDQSKSSRSALNRIVRKT
jgi:glycosyltransferase involved in cell wall biosynthesis